MLITPLASEAITNYGSYNMAYFGGGKKDVMPAGKAGVEAGPEQPKRPKGFKEMVSDAARRRKTFEDKAGRSVDARKAQGSAFLKKLWVGAKGWGMKLLSGAKTGVELGKKGVSGTADALFLDVGDMGTAMKAKAGEKLEDAGDALQGALAEEFRRIGAAGDAVGGAAFKGLEMGVNAYKSLEQRTIDAGHTLGARVDDIKARAGARYQEWQDNRPQNKIAKLQATIDQLQAQMRILMGSNAQTA